ncbi:MAG: biotin transporter BioY [Anaerolineales bacterium]
MTTLAPSLTIRYFPRASAWMRDALLVFIGSLFVAALAQIKIPLPFTPVPITAQTFGVLLVGAAFGSKRGAAALALYLAEGALGLPFFAGGAHGVSVLIGATGGYLIGFVLAAYATGKLAERGLERRVSTSVLPFLVGAALIYLCGILWLALTLGSLNKAIELGLLPFLLGDAVKLIAAALALPAAWKLAQ